MNNKKIFLIAIMLLSSIWESNVFAQNNRNILQKKALEIKLLDKVGSAQHFKPFPKYADSVKWQGLDQELKDRIIKKGEIALLATWKTLLASEYRLFLETGNRKAFEDKYFSRRSKLSDLVLAEMIEHKGRFLNKIIDGIYLICEESNWVVPAHGSHKLRNGKEDHYVDLFAAETSSLLAWTYYLLGDELNKITPQITERLKAECKKRIILPNLENDDFWWKGYNLRHYVLNNWNPWIVSNWLSTVLILEDDTQIRKRSLEKILACLDNYLNIQSSDGSCEEGPIYWTVAGGRVLQVLSLLQQATNGAFDVYKEPLIKKISDFFAKTHIAKNHFVNVGDGPYVMNDRAVRVFNYGYAQSNEGLMNTAKAVAQYYDPLKEVTRNQFGDLYINLSSIFNYDFFKKYPMKPIGKEEVWFPDLELLCTTIKNKDKDLFLSVLGANNAQSHNHNDVGNYLIFVDGEPAIIDVGVETYTEKTFSSRRYEIWTMQSDFHNLPLINGVSQKFGLEYRAANVVKTKNKLSMDISAAYPEDAKINSWLRTFEYDRGGIVISDDYSLKKNFNGVVLNQMTPLEVVENEKGNLVLLNKMGKVVLHVYYNPEQLSFSKEEIILTDPKLRKEWKQDKLCRFQLRVSNKKLEERIHVKYQ